MQLFTEWITQILIFILLGTVVELLLPKNQMKKYVHLVLGLLLLLLLTKPLFYIFSMDVPALVHSVDEQLFLDNRLMMQSENALEKQKKEIQHVQDAYIWNEVVAQLKQEANPDLQKRYAAEITDIVLELDNNNDVQMMTCILKDLRDDEVEQSRTIHPVEIETDSKEEEINDVQFNEKIAAHLADIWDMEFSQIQLQWEGGLH